MKKEEFCASDKIILSYFVPHSNGKFITSCLMLSDQVYNMIPTSQKDMILPDGRNWSSIDYSDLNFWWKDTTIDWVTSKDWFSNINNGPLDAVTNNQYCFYSCHEDYTVRFMKRIFPNAKILIVEPNERYVEANCEEKTGDRFIDSGNYKEFLAYVPMEHDVMIRQRDLYERGCFLRAFNKITETLDITIPQDRLLEYRDIYFDNDFIKRVLERTSDLRLAD